MHRFYLHRVTPFAELKKSYSLKSGAYSGGSSTSKEDKNDIICISPYVRGVHFELIVSDDMVYLSSSASNIEINFHSCTVPFIKRSLQNGDLIGIGCPTTQDCFENPDCYIFQLIRIGSDMDTPSLTSAPNAFGKEFGCHHIPSINQYRRVKYPLNANLQIVHLLVGQF